MCGIHAVISRCQDYEVRDTLRQALSNRGPDYFGSLRRSLPTSAQGDEETPLDRRVFLHFASAVLALRGDGVTEQPFEDPDTSSVLCWNGEAWQMDFDEVHDNDGEAIFMRLTNGNIAHLQAEARRDHILKVFRSIQGPFAFIFYDAPSRSLFFGRDRLGRRSLLLSRDSDAQSIAFSSIAATTTCNAWQEVEANGFYSISLDTEALFSPDGNMPFSNMPIIRNEWLLDGSSNLVSGIGFFNNCVTRPDNNLRRECEPVDLLRRHLTESLRLRVCNVPEPPTAWHGQDTLVAVLFSGGLDCTVLARLCHELIEPSQSIDLINVAFENPRYATQYQGEDFYERCPDRATGRKAMAELKTACSSRSWRFIAVNVPFQEAMAHRAQVVSLMYPHNTEMDLSIALALYFAGRGKGRVSTDIGQSDLGPVVTSPARVLLSGFGADELFGGYSRHPRAFEREGYSGLLAELELDVGRIGQRNLGRDDRILAHWGKEVRFPYLDETLFKFAVESSVLDKCDFGRLDHPSGIEPAKRILRSLAHQLSLPATSKEKKRAIQFGSRTAKLENSTGKVKGKALVS